MENCALFWGYFSHISWLWYLAAVFISFGAGALWYGFLFRARWIAAVKYECPCGADIAKGERCNCKPRFPVELLFQFASTAFLGLFYFVLVPVSLWLAVFACAALSAWIKSMLKFQIRDWRRFVALAWIDVGYFGVVSLIFILMALL